MKAPRAERSGGTVELRGLPAALAWALRRLPELLGDEAPGLAPHLAPSPYPAGTEEAEEWARNSAPGLRHLFATARELVLDDLKGLKLDRPADATFRLPIPDVHVNAWLSAIAAARVALGDVHEVGPKDMAADITELPRSERGKALLTIQLLGWIQAMLIE